MKRKKTTINISVDADTLSLLNHLAHKHDQSLEQVAEQLVEEAIENREDEALAGLEAPPHEDIELIEIIKERDKEPLETIPDDEAWR